MRNLINILAAGAVLLPNVANADPKLVQRETYVVPISDKNNPNREAKVTFEVYKDERRGSFTVAITTDGYNKPYNEKLDAVTRPENVFTGIYNVDMYAMRPGTMGIDQSTQTAFMPSSGIVNLVPIEDNPEKQLEFKAQDKIVDYALDKVPMGKDVFDRFATFSANQNKKDVNAEAKSISANYTATRIPMHYKPTATSLRDITTALVYEIPVETGKTKGRQTMSLFINSIGLGSPAQGVTGHLDNIQFNFSFENQNNTNGNGFFGNLFNNDNSGNGSGNERDFGGGGGAGGGGGSGGGAGGGGGGGHNIGGA